MKTKAPTTSKRQVPAAKGTGLPGRTPANAPIAVVPPSAAVKEKERGGIQSLVRAFAILEQVARHRDGITLAELCKAVGLHSSTTFHLVKTMVQLGYASQDTATKKYKVGSKAFSLAAGALDEIELVNRATPALDLLTSRSGESTHFAIRLRDDIVIAARAGGTGMFQLVDRAGAVRPGNATALGKVLLAALNPAQLDHYLDKNQLARFTPKTIVEPAALRLELDHVRRNGIAFDDGEFDAEVRCVAVPVYDFHGRVAGAIGLSGPTWRLSLQSLDEMSKLVRQTAAEISLELGFRGHQKVREA
ncbi:MAG: IclR family transcriptional regulator [Betaproteobacteria bacterium]